MIINGEGSLLYYYLLYYKIINNTLNLSLVMSAR